MCCGPEYVQLVNRARRHTACRPDNLSAELYVRCFQPVPLLRIIKHCISEQVCHGATAALCSDLPWNMAQPWENVCSLLSSAVVVAGLH